MVAGVGRYDIMNWQCKSSPYPRTVAHRTAGSSVVAFFGGKENDDGARVGRQPPEIPRLKVVVGGKEREEKKKKKEEERRRKKGSTWRKERDQKVWWDAVKWRKLRGPFFSLISFV